MPKALSESQLSSGMQVWSTNTKRSVRTGRDMLHAHQMHLFFGTEVCNSLLQGKKLLVTPNPGHRYWQPTQWYSACVSQMVSERQENLPCERLGYRRQWCTFQPCFLQVLAVIKRNWLLWRLPLCEVREKGATEVKPYFTQKLGSVDQKSDFHLITIDHSRKIKCLDLNV